MKYILILLLIITVASATPDKATTCMYCHNKLGQDFGGDDNDECGGCHYIVSNRQQHDINTCVVCHEVKDRNTYHQTHINVSCNTCHGSGDAIPSSTITDCAGCHVGQIHEIHQDKIDNICSNCHGIRPASNPTSGSVSLKKDITANIYAKVVNYKQFTMYEVFKRILSLFSL